MEDHNIYKHYFVKRMRYLSQTQLHCIFVNTLKDQSL